MHRTLREEQKNPDFVAAVLLGRHFSRAGQEYIFINGAQQVEFSLNYAIDSNMHFEKQMSDEIQNAALYFAEEVAQPDGVTAFCSGFYAGTSAVVLGERISGHQGIFF